MHGGGDAVDVLELVRRRSRPNSGRDMDVGSSGTANIPRVGRVSSQSKVRSVRSGNAVVMKFLIDKSPKHVVRKAASSLVRGQLLTPLTRYKNWGGEYAIDNGAFSGFDAETFRSLLLRESSTVSQCLFVTSPDIVGAAKRTLELFEERHRWIPASWPVALVAQNGIEDLDIPWNSFRCLFIGGVDPWKDSRAVVDLVKTAKTLEKHVHVGRVNTPKRFNHFDRIGADTCDGSGVAMYDHMLDKIERSRLPQPSLFDGV